MEKNYKVGFNWKNVLILLVFSLVMVVIIAGGSLLLDGRQSVKKDVNQETMEPQKQELKIEDLVIGKGIEAKQGNTITVNYKGTLLDGKQFDSSYDRKAPFSFKLGAGEVIKGWDQGFTGMKVGGKRKLTIPSELGYGSQGAGSDIPPNSTLIFEVELLEVK